MTRLLTPDRPGLKPTITDGIAADDWKTRGTQRPASVSDSGGLDPGEIPRLRRPPHRQCHDQPLLCWSLFHCSLLARVKILSLACSRLALLSLKQQRPNPEDRDAHLAKCSIGGNGGGGLRDDTWTASKKA